METKKAFLMYHDYEEQLKDLSDEELGQLVRAMFNYEIRGQETENLGFLSKMAFGFIKGNLIRDRQKYDRRSETSKNNGKKGGRPKTKKPSENLKKPKKADIDIEIEKDIDIDIDKDIEIIADKDIDCFSYCEEQFGRTLSSVEYNLIANWQNWFSDDIIKYAIEKTIKNGARGLNYTEAIINSWHDKGYTTLKQCQLEVKQTKHIEQVPNWYGKEIEEIPASEEEVKELEERLKRI